MAKLGKYTTGMSCLYLKRLGDVDLQVLEQLVRESLTMPLPGADAFRKPSKPRPSAPNRSRPRAAKSASAASKSQARARS
jgi:hypothetical protein